jgi:hypothetical protein
MGKHDDSGRGGNDRDDDRGNDDERHTTRSVEDDKQIATTPADPQTGRAA